MDGGRPGGGGGRGGRLRTAALVGGRCAVRFLGSDSLRACAVGRLRASSGSEAAGPEAAASWAACVSLAARRSPRSSLPASRLSPAARSSGRLAAARRSRRRCRLARTRPEKPVRDPGGGGRLGCSGLSRRPPVAPGSPQPTSPFPTIVLPMFGARRRALAPIRHLRPADAGVCASRSGGGASDSKTLPEYSPRPACDGGGHCATAGTPTQNAAYACGV